MNASPPTRSHRSAVVGVVLGLPILGLAGCGGGNDAGASTADRPSTSSSPSAAVTVTSSIKPGTVLGQPVVWRADVTAPRGVAIDHVDFLVDGQVRWTEDSEPYEFDEGGLFAPWPLGAGAHQLVVRAVTASGNKPEATAVVQVQKPSPGRLPAGSYHRTMTQTDIARVAAYRDAAHGAFGDPAQTGRWVMKVDSAGVITLDVVPPTEYDPFYEPYRVSGKKLTLYGPALWLQPHPDQASVFCEPEAPSTYAWSVRGSALTIRSVTRECADRDSIVVGTWQRG